MDEAKLQELVDRGFNGQVALVGDEVWKTAASYGIRKLGDPYSVFTIANWFIRKGRQDGAEMSPMRLTKLVFFSYAYNLALNDRRLFVASIEAWKYGPVLPMLYHEYKVFGSQIIPMTACRSDSGIDVPLRSEDEQFLENVYQVYRAYPTLDLSAITHNENSPWDVANKRGESIITDEMILAYYRPLLNGAQHG